MVRTTATGALAAALLFAPAALAQPDVDALADAVEPQVIAWRRHIHRYPELAYQEVKTAAYVAEALRAMPGIEVHTGIAKTGIKAILRGGRPGPAIALRADMDALPLEERTDLPFRSQVRATWQGKETGVMHACGHDAHVAMLLGAAAILSQISAELPGTVVFLFQPAEEWGGAGTPSGAFAMVQAGVLDDPKVQAVFGQHIGSAHPGGQIAYRRGSAMASSDRFSITVKGAGGHGAMPWLSRDPIVTGAQIVTNLQSIVSRQTNLAEGAAVITVGQFNAGNRANIIPEEAHIVGTIRTLTEATRQMIHEAITRMAQKTAEASGLSAEVKIVRGYPVLSNDPELATRMLAALERAAGAGRIREILPVLGSEDFGAFTQAAPGFFWFLNASPYPDRAGAPTHSPLFMIDEKYLKVGVKALVNVALEYLRAAR
ncbi:MAG TPA: amidohydrolase [Burkholderiaceae bacterium]|nr:amidohydrolase [Burkholderiaceae bacterium]